MKWVTAYHILDMHPYILFKRANILHSVGSSLCNSILSSKVWLYQSAHDGTRPSEKTSVSACQLIKTSDIFRMRSTYHDDH